MGSASREGLSMVGPTECGQLPASLADARCQHAMRMHSSQCFGEPRLCDTRHRCEVFDERALQRLRWHRGRERYHSDSRQARWSNSSDLDTR